MADLTIKEIGDEKAKLDKDIWALVKAFEAKTKTKIDWISFRYPDRQCGHCCCVPSHEPEEHVGVECHIDTGIFD